MRYLFILLLLITQIVQAETAVERLAGLLENMNTFSADFQQRLVSAKGQTMQQIKGQLKAKRPGLFYWYTAAPLEQELVSDGKQVWLYDPDLEQVTIQKLSAQLAKTPALLLNGEVSDIDLQYIVTEISNDSKNQMFKLIPRNPDSLFESLYLSFDQRQLSLMKLADSLGQKTTILFSGQKINKGVTDEDFRFDIPEGVDVIRQ